MKSKKNKDLADELMDDLLEDETPDLPDQQNVENDDDVIEVEAKQEDSTEEAYDFAQPQEEKKTEVIAEDKTEVVDSSVAQPNESVVNTKMDSQISEDTKKIHLKTTVGKSFVSTKSDIVARSGAFDHSLSRSENLRVAQEKILELEKEVEKLREENIELSAAGETMMKRYDSTFSENEDLRKQLVSKSSQYEGEIELLRDAITSKDAEIRKLNDKNESMETKVSANMQKIKVRERELENRLELVKMENAALLRSKNEMILDLKRNIDQLNLELEKYRKKGHDLNKQLEEKKDVLNRTVKTLRVALTLLESGGSQSSHLKKVK